VRRFSPPAEDDLRATLDALAAKDRGDDVDLVVGMIGALPRVSASFHELGMAEVLGKHVVVRGPGRLGEHEAIEGAFDRLSEEERTKLERDRQKHRAVAVFLHEVGHALGALHDREKTSLMAARYDVRMASFGDTAPGVMRVALEKRGDATALAKGVLEYLDGVPESVWSRDDRGPMVAKLQATLARANAAAAPPAEETDSKDDVSALTEDDRARFASARVAYHAYMVGVAWTTAEPLFTKYPSVVAVQGLRCELATLRHLEAAELKAECAALAKKDPPK
jgi:hypothetical protein